MRNGQLSPEGEAFSPLFLPRAVWLQRQKTRAKRKASQRSLPAGTRVPELSARISTNRGAPLMSARARKLHDSRNKVLVEFLYNMRPQITSTGGARHRTSDTDISFPAVEKQCC